MLTENEIVEKLTEFLLSRGYKIIQSLTTHQKGVDIIAESKFEKLYIEAKGETSSVKTSKRFGKPFNQDQIKTHISVALLATMKVISKMPAGNKTKTGIALPDTEEQRRVINQILPVLNKLDIRIYWITKTHIKIG